MAPGAVLAVHRLDELLQHVGIDLTLRREMNECHISYRGSQFHITYLILAEADDVHVDLFLLELLGDLDERRLVRVEWRPHEQDNASLVVLVLAVL